MKTNHIITRVDYTREQTLQSHGYDIVAGVDEAGRGPLAGPVTAAACILPLDFDCSILNDSKKLTEAQREDAYDIIISNARAWSTVSVTPRFIDTHGIVPAVHKTMRESLKKLTLKPNFILFDGYNINYPGTPQEALINGDAKIASIAAASIIAKVTRDRKMYEYDKKYPEYGFQAHKGYGTAVHMEAIKKHGYCPIHRKTFTCS